MEPNNNTIYSNKLRFQKSRPQFSQDCRMRLIFNEELCAYNGTTSESEIKIPVASRDGHGINLHSPSGFPPDAFHNSRALNLRISIVEKEETGEALTRREEWTKTDIRNSEMEAHRRAIRDAMQVMASSERDGVYKMAQEYDDSPPITTFTTSYSDTSNGTSTNGTTGTYRRKYPISRPTSILIKKRYN